MREILEREECINNDPRSSQSLGADARALPQDSAVIENTVRQDWRLLNTSGSNRLGGAIMHYQQHGLDYLH